MAEETKYNVTYKAEEGSLLFTDKVFHYTSNSSRTSVKCSWARVEKRQLSPANSSLHMIKFVLVSGKTAVFEVRDRETLEEVRNDAQRRMERELLKLNSTSYSRTSRSTQQRDGSSASAGTGTGTGIAGMVDPSSSNNLNLNGSSQDLDQDRDRDNSNSRDWVDEPCTRKSQHTRTRTSTTSTGNRKCGDACGWCLFGSLMCWMCACITFLLVAIAAFLVYWFIFQDDDDEVLRAIGIPDGPTTQLDTSKPPDYGNEARYGIRSVFHDWNQDELTLNYKVSDYILDSSMHYVIYDGLDCRRSNNDITSSNKYLFIDFKLPTDGGADLTNEGRGSRDVDLHFTLNKGEITQAPFFLPNGLDMGRLNFCLGLVVNYNQVDYWSRVEEVNAVETAIQLDIDLSDFRRITDAVVKTIIRPKYNRRNLLRSSSSTKEADTTEQEE